MAECKKNAGEMVFSRRMIDVARQLDLTMLDLGARNGFDCELISLAGGIRAIGFEPEPSEAAKLSKSNHAPWHQVKMIGCAVGGRTGPAKLHIPGSADGASLLPHNDKMLEEFGYEALHKTVKTIDVSAITLDDLTGDGLIDKAHYIKIDIEGAELEVLRAGTRTLQSCHALKVEVSFLEQRIGQPIAHEVIAFLEASGFSLADIRGSHHWRRRPLPAHPYLTGFAIPYSRGRIAQADVLFFRRHDSRSPPESAAAAVLIAAAMGYFDHAMTLLRGNTSSVQWWTDHGVDIEAEMKTTSKRYGRHALRCAIQQNVGGLWPLFRSLFGQLPYKTPDRAY